jgi:small subunit ribosomal protein S20
MLIGAMNHPGRRVEEEILRDHVAHCVEHAIASGNKDAAAAALKSAEPELMRAARHGIVHKKTASRKVSRLVKRLATLGK